MLKKTQLITKANTYLTYFQVFNITMDHFNIITENDLL